MTYDAEADTDRYLWHAGDLVMAADSGIGETMTDPLTAAAEPQTGAMVALIPADADAARLAVAGGEPVEELHCTLMYLGEAADIPAEARQAIIDAVTAYVDGWPPVQADGFAVSLFNPGDANDRDTCVVLGLSGDDLDMVHDMVGEAVRNVEAEPAGFTLPDQHAPWHAHTTLVYTGDARAVAALADRVGPITFDRVRIAFAGETTDVTLDAPHPDEVAAEGEAPPPDGMAVAEFAGHMPAKLQAYWLRRLAPWGGPGSFTRCARALQGHPGIKDPKGACANLYKTATGRWPGADHHSVGGCDGCGTDFQTEAAMAETPSADATLVETVANEPPEQSAAQPGEHFHTWVTEGVSTGRRILMPGAVTWRDPPFAYHWMTKSSAHGGTAEVVQAGRIVRGERTGDTAHWWGQLDLKDPLAVEHGRKIVEGWIIGTSVGPDEHLHGTDVEVIWPEGVGLSDDEAGMFLPEPQEERFHSFPVGELTGVSLPALADARIEPTQDLIDALVELGVLAEVTDPSPIPIVAAGYTITIPDLPPAAWFDEPDDDELPPFGVVEIDERGRLIGRLAPRNYDGTGNHRSFPGKSIKVPMGNVDYSGWMNKRWPVAEGHKVYVGVITMDCGHASVNPGDWSYHNRREHYDNSCSVAAHARIYEKPGIGPVMAGAVAPWLDAEGIGRLMSCDLSGDWPPHPDKPGLLDFTAALAVPVGGFPNRVKARSRDGILVASAVPVRFIHGESGPGLVAEPRQDLRPTLKRIARSIGRDAETRMAELHARVARTKGDER